jgi:hypothetical protein
LTSSSGLAVFRDLWDVAQVIGTRAAPGGTVTVIRGTYVMHAATDDGVVHLVELRIGSIDDFALTFPCRGLIVDHHGEALSHLRSTGVPVDCMTCLVRGLGR